MNDSFWSSIKCWLDLNLFLSGAEAPPDFISKSLMILCKPLPVFFSLKYFCNFHCLRFVLSAKKEKTKSILAWLQYISIFEVFQVNLQFHPDEDLMRKGKSWKKSTRKVPTGRISSSSASLSYLPPLLWFQGQAAINTARLFNHFTGGGTVGRSVDHSMPPLLFSPPLARPLCGRVLRFGQSSESQWQVDRW